MSEEIMREKLEQLCEYVLTESINVVCELDEIWESRDFSEESHFDDFANKVYELEGSLVIADSLNDCFVKTNNEDSNIIKALSLIDDVKNDLVDIIVGDFVLSDIYYKVRLLNDICSRVEFCQRWGWKEFK